MVWLNARSYTFLALGLVLHTTLWSCGSAPATVEESDPFVAAARRANAQHWQELLRRAELFVATAAVGPDQLEILTDRLRADRDNALREQGSLMSLAARRRSAQLIAQLEHRRRMTASPSRASLVQRTFKPTVQVHFDWPVREPIVSSSFGVRADPFAPGRRSFHNGIDFAAPEGTEVYPAAEGEVLEAGFRNDGCGLAVTIVHPNRFASDYCHLAAVQVEVGQRVTRSIVLGKVGNTGRSTGAHLHWSLWRAGTAIDPRRVMGPSATSPR